MTREVRKKLKVRNTAFKSSDEAVFKSVRASLNRAFMLERFSFFCDPSNTRCMWQGIQAIIAYKATPTLYDNNPHLFNNLNKSFCRFATDNTPAIKTSLQTDEKALNLNAADTWKTLGKVNVRKPLQDGYCWNLFFSLKLVSHN